MLAGIATGATGATKVTSRKAAVRLLAGLGGTEALELLATAWRDEPHRDVRAAMVAAAAGRLDAAPGWQIVQQAAAGGREQMFALLATRPHTVAEPDRRRYAELVARACGSEDRVVARAAWLRLPSWAPWAPPGVAEVPTAALCDLAGAQLWVPAVADAVVALLDHAGPAPEPPVLHTALAGLVRADAEDSEPGGPERDRPARRRIGVVVNRAAHWAGRAGPDSDREPVREAARWLARQPGYRPAGATLLAHLVRFDPPAAGDLVADLAELAEQAGDRPVLAAQLASTLNRGLLRRTGAWQPATILAAAGALRQRGDLAGGLFAVALAGVAGGQQGWAGPWRELVHALRQHPVADVRAAGYDLDLSRTSPRATMEI